VTGQDITHQRTQEPIGAPRPDGADAAATAATVAAAPRPDRLDGTAMTATATTPPAAGARTRLLRADAVRNRTALLEAAHAVLRERGLATQMDDVAARAGLGVGTLYRHFPTKEALLDVVVRERHQTIVDAARAALRAPDPWEGFTSFLWRVAEMEAEDRTVTDLMLDAHGRVDPAPFYQEVSKAMRSLTRRARRAGAMRKDVSGEEAVMAVCAIGKHLRAGSGMPGAGAGGADSWRRLVRVIVDGMRAPAPTAD
jgi:AcrR family transcriptional regulator